MPYVRLYSSDMTIEQKRLIAQKLIEITLRTFHLRNRERNRITIQFISPPQGDVVESVGPTPPVADFTVEVITHNLTDAKKREFAAEATAMLTDLMPLRSRGRIARLLGIKADAPRQIAFQFGELNPAVSEPLVFYTDSQAA